MKESHKKVVKKAKSRGISMTGEGGYARHVLLCIGKSCCEGEDHHDGIWYHSVTPKVLDRIIDEHLVGGKVIAEYAFANNPMTETAISRPT